MDGLGHSSFPPTALGRQDDEEANPGVRSLHLLLFCRSITPASCQFLLLYVGVEIGVKKSPTRIPISSSNTITRTPGFSTQDFSGELEEGTRIAPSHTGKFCPPLI
ncbi:hypothetical protein TNCV_2075981 [Trichonephila clavipes]|nr:hypothetical protein TNCV_2075981 [Trichonephila clavipes]